ncbi:MAG: WYL domain-containing protein [Shimia sp.]
MLTRLRSWLRRPAVTEDKGRRRMLAASLAAMSAPMTSAAGPTGPSRAEDLRLLRALAHVDSPVLRPEIEAIIAEISARRLDAPGVVALHRFFAQSLRRGWVPMEDATIPALQAAVDEAVGVTFTYTDLQGRETRRSVLPIEIVSAPTGSQLLARCELRGGQRRFFLREIRDLRVDGGTFLNERPALLADALAHAEESAIGPRG